MPSICSAGDGSYTVTGSAQGDTFDMKVPHFTASDFHRRRRRAPTRSTLDGDYSGANALTFGATTMVNVEVIDHSPTATATTWC